MKAADDLDTGEKLVIRLVGDSRLRHYGFTIHGRPANGPVTWKRGNRVVLESVAQRLVDAELLAKLQGV